MKRTLRLLIIIAAAFAVVGGVRATEEEDESFSKKVKDFLVRTPTPMPRKHRKTSATPKKKEAPSPSPGAPATPKPSATRIFGYATAFRISQTDSKSHHNADTGRDADAKSIASREEERAERYNFDRRNHWVRKLLAGSAQDYRIGAGANHAESWL